MKWFSTSLPRALILTVTLPVGVLLYVSQQDPIQSNTLQQAQTQPGLIENNPAEENESKSENSGEQAAANKLRVAQRSRDGIPDFSAYMDVQQKKRVFFEFMLPLIRKANTSIREYRVELENIVAKLDQGEALTTGEHQRLNKLFNRYRFEAPLKVQAGDVEQLLERVDIVPASLVLAQAANESGWGTSRFATEANNYFGVWCFTTGCGVEPLNRDEGKTHEVALYDSVQEGVTAYIHNINTHRAYEVLRLIRSEQRYSQNLYMGSQLADGLMRYSARGEEYVLEIQQMIRTNNLHEYTLPTPTSV